ncbi:MAG: glycosyltransferase family 2 protein [Casimicrobiaceae bacterium]
MAYDGVWVVIPAYNEAATIRDVAVRALCVLPRVIIVDDGSADATSDALAGVAVVVLRNASNCGKAASLVRGFEHALAHGAEAVITLDADCQHRPEDIPLLVEAAHHHRRHIVIAARVLAAEDAPKSRRRANRVADFWIAWAAGHPIADSQSGFRLYPAELLRSIALAHDRAHGFVFESEILIEAAHQGFLTVAVPVAALYPVQARASHFRPVRDIARITRMVAWRLLRSGLNPAGLVRSLAPSVATRGHYRAPRLRS